MSSTNRDRMISACEEIDAQAWTQDGHDAHPEPVCDVVHLHGPNGDEVRVVLGNGRWSVYRDVDGAEQFLGASEYIMEAIFNVQLATGFLDPPPAITLGAGRQSSAMMEHAARSSAPRPKDEADFLTEIAIKLETTHILNEMVEGVDVLNEAAKLLREMAAGKR